MANRTFIAVFIEEADIPQALPTGLAGGPAAGDGDRCRRSHSPVAGPSAVSGPLHPDGCPGGGCKTPLVSRVAVALAPGGQGPRWGRRGFQTQASLRPDQRASAAPLRLTPGRGGGSGLHPEWLRELVPRKAEAAQTPARWAASQTPSPTTLAVPRACSCSPHLGSPLTPAYARLRPTAPDVQMPHPKAHVVQEDQGSPSPSASAAPDFILQFHKPRVSETGSRWFCAHLPADRRQGQRLPLLPLRSSCPPTVS